MPLKSVARIWRGLQWTWDQTCPHRCVWVLELLLPPGTNTQIPYMDLPCMELTVLAGSVLELTRFPISCHLCDKLTSPPVMLKARGEIQLVTNHFLTEGFSVFAHYWNTSWVSCGQESPQLNPLSLQEHLVGQSTVMITQTPIWATHLRAGLDPWGPLPTPNILWICDYVTKKHSQFPTKQTWPAITVRHLSP